MAKKKSTNEEIAKIKKALEAGKLIIGTNRVLKGLKLGKLGEVFCTTNCHIKEDLAKYPNVVLLDISNEELGVLCKKPFSINLVGISKSD